MHVTIGFNCGRNDIMFGSTLPLYFFLGALLYCFPKESLVVFVALIGLRSVMRR